jgi:hypothetical protein
MVRLGANFSKPFHPNEQVITCNEQCTQKSRESSKFLIIELYICWFLSTTCHVRDIIRIIERFFARRVHEDENIALENVMELNVQ